MRAVPAGAEYFQGVPGNVKSGSGSGGDEVVFESAAVKGHDDAARFADQMMLVGGATGEVAMLLGSRVDGVDGTDLAEGVEGSIDGAAGGLNSGIVQGG